MSMGMAIGPNGDILVAWPILAKVLDYNMVYSQGLPNDKKVG